MASRITQPNGSRAANDAKKRSTEALRAAVEVESTRQREILDAMRALGKPGRGAFCSQKRTCRSGSGVPWPIRCSTSESLRGRLLGPRDPAMAAPSLLPSILESGRAGRAFTNPPTPIADAVQGLHFFSAQLE